MARPAMTAYIVTGLTWLMMVTKMMSGVEGFDSVLLEGFYMGPNQEICEFPFTFKMQRDCNLVLYRNNVKPIWATNTMHRGKNCFFVMQDDGNAVLWSDAGEMLWQTNTGNMNNGPHFIKVQCDGNVVMYNVYGYPLWATDTNVSQLSLNDMQLNYNSTHSNEPEQTVILPPKVAQATKTLAQ
ncbi:hypothetical protein R1flu_019343 [Riccia fluitans]|uniref:Bulb-type lectin domain-containing protein n=1 Tax=Riccia fluitans TaxID=41844 RepID=A0ABD1ZJV6_9MARC